MPRCDRRARSPTRRACSRPSASGATARRTRSSRRGSAGTGSPPATRAGATTALRKAAGVVPGAAVARPGPDPRAARPGADDRGRVQRLGAGGLRGPPDRPRPGRRGRARGDPRHDDARGGPGWGDDPEEGVRLLREAIERARELGLVEEWWRAGANMAVVLELLGRPGEAIDQAFRDMAEARAMDLDAVYANLLGGNVAGILVDVGRWPEARELSLRALDWSPAGVPFVNAILNLVIVEIESEAGEEAGRLLGPGARRARDRRRLPVRGAGLPGDGVVRDVERRPRRRAAGRRARLGARPRHRGLGPDGPHGGDRARGRVGDRGRGPREATDRRRRRVPRAGRTDPRGGRRRGRAGAGRRRRPRDAASPRRASRRRARSTAGCRVATTRRPGPTLAGRWHDLGDPYREGRARWRQAEAILGGATAGVAGIEDADGRAGRPRRRARAARPRPSSSRCASTRGRSCARCASSPAAR